VFGRDGGLVYCFFLLTVNEASSVFYLDNVLYKGQQK